MNKLIFLVLVLLYSVIRLLFIDKFELFIIKNNMFKRILACYGINKTIKKTGKYNKIIEYGFDIILVFFVLLYLLLIIFVYPLLFVIANIFIKDSSTYIERYKLALKYPTNIYKFTTGHYDLVNSYKSYEDYLSKFYWNAFFIKHNAPIPKLYGISEFGNVTIFNTLNKKEYLIKPDKAMGGSGIKIITNINQIPKNDVFLIQQKINQKVISHLRVITFKTKKGINVYQSRYHEQLNKNKVTTNFSKKIYYFVYEYEKLDVNLDIPKCYRYYYNAIITKCIEMHNILPLYIVGWDIMCNDSGYYFLEGNINSSICCEKDKFYTCSKNYFKSVKQLY